MRVVILHYHLHPGGVTRIIESQVSSMAGLPEDITWMVLTGTDGNSSGLPGECISSNNALYYNDQLLPGNNLTETVERIIGVIRASLTNDAILHCHNPNLGKNPALTIAVYQLAREGYAVVNHCHDFAEDRPANMELLEKLVPGAIGLSLSEVLYPRFANYHFIVLNSCDYQRILEKGIPPSRAHLLPNPVHIGSREPGAVDPDLRRKICATLGFDPGRKICTYPVRAIARKNLGEFILLSALFADQTHFTVTQPPKNPLEMTGYLNWKHFCQDRKILIKFESGSLVNHEELINISDFCITTSIQEGFGMAFLESWLAGTPVIGRDIPCVTNDLKKAGIDFPLLYSGISIKSGIHRKDFKDLTVEGQKEIIVNVLCDKSATNQIFQDNPFLSDFLEDVPGEVILRNQHVVRNEFSIEKYGKKLLAIYRDVSQRI